MLDAQLLGLTLLVLHLVFDKKSLAVFLLPAELPAGPLLHAKFHIYRGRNVGIQPPKLSKFGILPTNLLIRGDWFAQFLCNSQHLYASIVSFQAVIKFSRTGQNAVLAPLVGVPLHFNISNQRSRIVVNCTNNCNLNCNLHWNLDIIVLLYIVLELC